MAFPIVSAYIKYTEKPDLEMFSMHTHDTYEIYCFLSGNAKYYVEGSIYSLKPEDILIMKKAEAHSLLINKCVPYERIIVNFNSEAVLGDNNEHIIDFLDNRPLGVNNRYPASLFKGTSWIYYLKKIYNSKDNDKKRLYLTVLLNELCECYPDICGEPSAVRDNITEIINYINAHLTEDLNLDGICSHFYISKAQINRKFKAVTGSTVWEYIITKRILLAKELLGSGKRPTDIYLKCGFNDYCSFFKAYKAKFGNSPKNDINKK